MKPNFKDWELVERKLRNFNLGGVKLDDYFFDISDPMPDGYEILGIPKLFGNYMIILYRNEEIETVIEEHYKMKD